MNLLEPLQIASSEEKSEEFLRQKGVPITFDSCPFL
jgi:transposase